MPPLFSLANLPRQGAAVIFKICPEICPENEETACLSHLSGLKWPGSNPVTPIFIATSWGGSGNGNGCGELAHQQPFLLLDTCGDSRKARKTVGFSSVPGGCTPLFYTESVPTVLPRFGNRRNKWKRKLNMVLSLIKNHARL